MTSTTQGPLQLTVVTSTDVGDGPRCLKLQLSDGQREHLAIERSVLPFSPQAGDELQLANVKQLLGTFLLEPHSCTLIRRGSTSGEAAAVAQRASLASLWAKGDVDASEPPPRFTQLGSGS